jgi:hypothetical protein
MIANRVAMVADVFTTLKSMASVSRYCFLRIWLGYSKYHVDIALLEGHSRPHPHTPGKDHTHAELG